MSNQADKILKQFRANIADPGAYARVWKEKYQKGVVGFFCSYAPEEILVAADVLPFRIFGASKQISLADAHLQAYSCSLVRGALEDGLAGDLDFLNGTVFPHTCDSIMRLSDMWRMNLELDFHLDVAGSDLNTVVKASMFMHRQEVDELLESLLVALKEKEVATPSNGKRLLLAGGLCSMPDIFNIIETSGGIVVGDDFCTGARYAAGEIEASGDIMAAIADRYAERIVCPAKHAGLYSRGDHVLHLAKEKQADGVIFMYLKFCDPHAFDYPYMCDMLEEAGIPSMVFEIEDRLPSEGQFKTRCEAFIEML